MYKNSLRSKAAGRLLRSEYNHIKGAIASAAKDVKKNVKRRSIKLQGKVAHEIGDKPFQAVGIAMLSGMIITLMMRKKAQQIRKRHLHD